MHLFSTGSYLAGFSEADDGNLWLINQSLEKAHEAWNKALEKQGFSLPFPRFAKQVHLDQLIQVSGESTPGNQGPGDAVATRERDLPIGVFTADCLPILIAGKGIVAAIHAGWKSTRLDIVGKTIVQLATQTGLSPKDLDVFMGPCIGQCCLELGDEVPPTFFETDSSFSSYFSRGKKWHLDLRALNCFQAIRQGVDPARIKHVPDCTKCLTGTYFSYRGQNGIQGSMFSFIVRR